MVKMYRLIYKDGSKGAWDFNKQRIKNCAKYFDAEIEESEYNGILKKRIEMVYGEEKVHGI